MDPNTALSKYSTQINETSVEKKNDGKKENISTGVSAFE